MELSTFNETPEGRPQSSVTYLAGEEEALEKGKGRHCMHINLMVVVSGAGFR